jgi:hypothetical protein
MKFIPCNGECTEDGTHCKGCGRSHEEIAETKKMVKALVVFAQKMEYENIEEFANSIGANILKKLQDSS